MRVSRAVAIGLLGALACLAADMPKGLFRGSLVRWEGSPSKGLLLARNQAGVVQGCGYDSLSYLELSRQRVTVTKLEPGDPLEIITDHKPGSRDCYIRMLHVVPPAPPPSRVKAAAERRPLAPRVNAPLGDRTVSGFVVRFNAGSVTLRTREGEQTLLLRRDTRYLADGVSRGPSDLAVNTRVFVRAGPNLEGDIEALQIMWGEILGAP